MSYYNLLDENWIPVLYLNGEFTRLSVKKTLEDAHLIRQIAASNPMDRVAIIRFLLAILYWCKGNPPKEENEIPTKFPMEWFEKLDQNRECFNLFGDGKRFYQDESTKSKNMLPIGSLIHEIPTGTSIYHFRHAIDGKVGICPVCCAFGLLRLPVFTTQGGRGKGPGINNKPPLYIIPLGKTLLETLFISYKPVFNLGSPSWDTQNNVNTTDGTVPLLNGLTDLPRIVRLGEPTTKGQCINCGVIDSLITKCVFNDNRNRYGNAKWEDPHVAYFKSKSLSTDNPLKIWFKTDRPWTTLLNYFLETNLNPPQNFLIVGFASDQAKHIDIWERILKIPKLDNSENNAQFQKEWDEAIKKIPNLIKNSKRKKNLNEQIIIRIIRPHIEKQISSNLSSIIDGTIQPWDFASSEFKKVMPILAKSLTPGFLSADIDKQTKIASFVPIFKSTNNQKSKKLKGKDKDESN